MWRRPLVRLPRRERPPLVEVGLRVLLALALLFASAVVVYLDRDGYRDSAGGPLSFLDALYYATVSLTTTGYGDIVPFTSGARLLTILLITPLRVLFLVILVSTTLAVLTERGREQLRVSRWRSSVRRHTIICGFGTKGRAAARALIADGTNPRRIVVVDPRQEAVLAAEAMGLAVVQADAERTETLHQAELKSAASVLVTVHNDNNAAMITLTVRQINPTIDVFASVREQENVPLLRQSGARTVVTSSETAGRLVGLSACKPSVATIAQDLFSYGHGLDLKQRPVTPDEVGRRAAELPEVVLAVVPAGSDAPVPLPAATAPLAAGDALVFVRFPDD
ncbi:potassium channel family protein [Actinocatenispora sera]|uniref:potassium channel family protein n=1 Tax=Actinocatenispora sera TaxID=390989 RepID=UPI0033FA1753